MKKIFTLLFAGAFFISLSLSGFADSLTDLYDQVPNKSNCFEGVLKQSEKDKVLLEVNKIRAIHKLKPVVYNSAYDNNTSKSALMTASNEELSHTPPTTWSCYTLDGYNGSSSSNLYIAWNMPGDYQESVKGVYSWMNDENVEVCGHRRWLIDPFLKEISFGRCDFNSTKNTSMIVSGMSIWVIDDNYQDLSDWTPDFVAYPYENYPTKYFYTDDNSSWYLSFSAVSDKSNFWSNNNVNYSNATIEMTDPNGGKVTISSQTSNNDFYGLGNALLWKTSTLSKETIYAVKISNVQVNGQNKNYSYWFKLTDQEVGSAPEAPVLKSPEDNSKNIAQDTILKWNASTDATTYHLKLSTSSDLSSNVKDINNIETTTYAVKGLTANTKYYWAVSAKNNNGESDFSDIYSFTTLKAAPGLVTLVYPASNTANIPRDTTLVWRKNADADSYSLQVSSSSSFDASSLIVNETQIADTLYAIPYHKLNLSTVYYWHVLATNTGGTGAWSNNWYFKTMGVDNIIDINNSIGAKLFPNPAKNRAGLTFTLANTSLVSYEVVNISGQKIISKNAEYLNPNEYTYGINLDGFSAGSYFMNLVINGKVNTIKFNVTE